MTNSETTCEERSVAPDSLPKGSLSARALVRVVRGYQFLRAGRQSPCRFYPSCSEYAVEAVEVHGVLRGSVLAARRVLRCNPFGPHGVDLVPLAKERSER